MRCPRGLAAVALALLFVAAGCSSGRSESAGDPGKPYNDSDVAFATDMIQHHAQALEMVDLTAGRRLDPAVTRLADDIRAAQAPEIEQLVDLLNSWDDQPIPETGRDHANAHGGDGMHADTDMPGMMSGEDMAALEDAEGPEFQALWLEKMIEHHEGAVEMAARETDDGEDKEAKALAADIVSGQNAQIGTMRELLDG